MKNNDKPDKGVLNAGLTDEAGALYGSTMSEWFDAKHRAPSAEEIDMVNAAVPESCPFCGAGQIIRYGVRKDGVRRYMCKSCGGQFNPLTGTLFDSRKIPISEWIEFLIHLIEFHSVKTSASDNRNAETTGRYWLLKVFEALKGYQDDIVLSGRVYIDEAFFEPIHSQRPRQPDGLLVRGYGDRRIGVCCGTDGTRSFLIVAGEGRISREQFVATYGPHIKAKSTLVHDGDVNHRALVEAKSLKSEVHLSEDTKGLPDSENPLDPINEVHFLAKRFMGNHGAFDRSNLQDWMNLIAFILNPPCGKREKVISLIKMMMKCRKTVRYRSVISKKRR